MWRKKLEIVSVIIVLLSRRRSGDGTVKQNGYCNGNPELTKYGVYDDSIETSSWKVGVNTQTVKALGLRYLQIYYKEDSCFYKCESNIFCHRGQAAMQTWPYRLTKQWSRAQTVICAGSIPQTPTSLTKD